MKAWLCLVGGLTLLTSYSASASSPAATGLFALASDPGTVASNPAGMARLKEGGHSLAELMVVESLSRFDVDGSVTTVDGGDPDTDRTPVTIPSIYYVNSLNEDWRYGFTINVPTGFGSNDGASWAGRYYSGNFTLVYIA